jgi:hypothetical protein
MPRVRLVAKTEFIPPDDVPWTTDADGGAALVEFAGRACYQSWDRSNPMTNTNATFLHHLLDVGHLATGGIGFSFYFSRMASFGLEWRALPFARNTGGFDNRGAGPDKDFPDRKINSNDREFKFNQMLTISFGLYLPFDHQVSE